MQALTDLLKTPKGLRFLESRGVFVGQQEFKGQLRAPARPILADSLGAENKQLVCSGQQLYVDYQYSVLSKILALQELEQDENLFPFFMWVDTDRSGSDNLITKFAWPTNSKKGPIRIAPSGTQDIEERFVRLDATQLRSAIDKMGTHLRQSGVRRKTAKAKYLRLRALFDQDQDGRTLGDFNYQVTHFLLDGHLGFSPYSVMLSDMLRSGLVTDEVNQFINHLDGVVKVFNESVRSLRDVGIDPQVKPRNEDYLPLFYSCDVDDHRFRLHHEHNGGGHFAVGTCKCGEQYNFYLGGNTLSIEEIAQTNRWSPDVLLPAFFNDLVSGFVAGKSSALYLLVVNSVLRQVLGKEPVPILVPEGLARHPVARSRPDSLLYDFFNAVN